MILPRSGRMAWYSRMRPPSALPPAESPSTRYNSQRIDLAAGAVAEFAGQAAAAQAPLRSRTSWRALRALSRASAANRPFCTMIFAVLGFSSRYEAR